MRNAAAVGLALDDDGAPDCPRTPVAEAAPRQPQRQPGLEAARSLTARLTRSPPAQAAPDICCLEPLLRSPGPGCFSEHRPVRPDEPGDRNHERPRRSVSEQLVLAQADEHRIVHLVLRGERPQVLRRVVDRDAEDGQLLRLVLLDQLDERRESPSCRGRTRSPRSSGASGRPLKSARLHVLAVHVLQREVEVARSPAGTGSTRRLAPRTAGSHDHAMPPATARPSDASHDHAGARRGSAARSRLHLRSHITTLRAGVATLRARVSPVSDASTTHRRSACTRLRAVARRHAVCSVPISPGCKIPATGFAPHGA